MNEEMHEGKINLILSCDDDTTHDGTGDYLDPEFLDQHGLKPGDRIQYRLLDDEVEILGKVQIKKTIEKLD